MKQLTACATLAAASGGGTWWRNAKHIGFVSDVDAMLSKDNGHRRRGESEQRSTK
jgi:hypothetical protein